MCIKERIEQDNLGAMVKLPKGVKSVKESAGGVLAEWLIAPDIPEDRVLMFYGERSILFIWLY